MMTAKDIIKKLEAKFGSRISIQKGANEKQYFVLLKDKQDNRDVVKFFFKDLGARLNIMTGIDGRDFIEVLYHLSFDIPWNGFIFTVKALVEKPLPNIDTVSDIITGAKWIEREIYELFNVKFKGHPELIPLLRSDTRPADYFPFQREVKDTHVTIRDTEKGTKEK
jgi:NADH:ubiquinone oxidoreductase subunit C